MSPRFEASGNAGPKRSWKIGKRCRCLLIASLLAIYPIQAGPAAEEAKEALSALSSAVRGLSFELADFPVQPGGQQKCEDLLADLLAGRDVDVIAPLAQSSRYDDPVFAPWQGRCPALAMNGRVGRAPRTLGWQLLKLDRITGHQPVASYEFGTADFRLYELELDGEPANGPETLFFADRFYSYWHIKFPREKLASLTPASGRNWNAVEPPESVSPSTAVWPGSYQILDVRQCRADVLLQVSTDYGYLHGEPGAAMTGLFRHRGTPYIYDLWVIQRDSDGKPLKYRLDIVEISTWNDGTRQIDRACVFHQP